MGPYSHTKFECNRPSRLPDMKEGCARAHVQIHPNSTLCKRKPVSKHTPNLSVIGQAVMELPRVWCLRHPLTQHVPRAVAGTGVYRCRSNTKLIGWWHRTKKTARALVIPFQRYKRLKIVTVPVILTFLRYMHIHGCSRCRSKYPRRSPIQILTGSDAAWLFLEKAIKGGHP